MVRNDCNGRSTASLASSLSAMRTPGAMRIGIVGGGPAGLVAALAARQQGFEATVFEQASDFRRVGGGIALQSNGMRVLDALGVLPALRPRLRPFRVVTIERAGRGPLLRLDFSRITVPHNEAAMLLRYELQETLRMAVQQAGVPVRFDSRCVRVAGPEVHLADGAAHAFDVVIAADGIHSAVRTSLGLRARTRAVGEAALRGVAEIALQSGEVRELWGADGRLFGIGPLPGERTYFYCSAPRGRWQETLAGGLSAWIESWRPFGPEAPALLRAVPDWSRVSYDELREVRVPSWYRGPVFLIGDAAHAMTPNLGQGANSAMVDALVLVRLLAETPVLADAGRRYEAVRRRFVTTTQRASRLGGSMPRWRSPLARVVVDGALRLQNRVGWLTRPMLTLGAGYNRREERYLAAAPARR